MPCPSSLALLPTARPGRPSPGRTHEEICGERARRAATGAAADPRACDTLLCAVTQSEAEREVGERVIRDKMKQLGWFRFMGAEVRRRSGGEMYCMLGRTLGVVTSIMPCWGLVFVTRYSITDAGDGADCLSTHLGRWRC